MKFLIFLTLFFSFTVHAACELCAQSEQLVQAWDKAKTSSARQKAAKDSHALLVRLGVGIHNGDNTLIAPLVRLFGAIYARDYDPLYADLETFLPDLAKPEFRTRFDGELDKLPSGQKQKIMDALAILKGGHEPDDDLD